MAKARSALRTSVEETLGRTDKTTVVNDGLDFGLQSLTRRHQWLDGRIQRDITLAVSDNSEVLNSAVVHLVEVRIIDGTNGGWKVRIWRKQRFVELVPNVLTYTNSKPRIAYFEGGTLYFAPPSDDTYVLRYTSLDTQTFADDTATSPYDETDEALIAYATSYAFRSIENFDSADQWERRFDKLALEAINLDLTQMGIEDPHQPHGFNPNLTINPDFYNDPFVMETP